MLGCKQSIFYCDKFSRDQLNTLLFLCGQFSCGQFLYITKKMIVSRGKKGYLIINYVGLKLSFSAEIKENSRTVLRPKILQNMYLR